MCYIPIVNESLPKIFLGGFCYLFLPYTTLNVAPTETQNEPLARFSSGSLIHLLETIQYPQRFGLERLLTAT